MIARAAGEDDGPEQRAVKPEALDLAIVFFCTALPAADSGSPPAAGAGLRRRDRQRAGRLRDLA
jgi:hypothetical protein